jgi:hypothetical protein
MHVVELLHVLFMREDVEWHIAPLPKPIMGVSVDGGREAQPGQQGATSGIALIAGQGGNNLLRLPLLQFLHEADDGFGRFGSNQQVKVIGHQNPAIQKEPGFRPKLAPDRDKHPTESLASKEAAAAVGAGGDELQLAALEMASISWHHNSIGRREGKRESQSCARSAPACAVACLGRCSEKEQCER